MTHWAAFRWDEVGGLRLGRSHPGEHHARRTPLSACGVPHAPAGQCHTAAYSRLACGDPQVLDEPTRNRLGDPTVQREILLALGAHLDDRRAVMTDRRLDRMSQRCDGPGALVVQTVERGGV
jgi:hypothetical protein